MLWSITLSFHLEHWSLIIPKTTFPVMVLIPIKRIDYFTVNIIHQVDTFRHSFVYINRRNGGLLEVSIMQSFIFCFDKSYSCTELYPSPTNNDMTDPGLNWTDQTLYTTGEPVNPLVYCLYSLLILIVVSNVCLTKYLSRRWPCRLGYFNSWS